MSLALMWNGGMPGQPTGTVDISSPRHVGHMTSRSRHRAAAALVPGLAVASMTLGLAGCGSSSGGSLKVSASAGPVGTVVTITGNAGSGCAVGTTWQGFSFERSTDGPAGKAATGGPRVVMVPPPAANGSWSAIFSIPSYLGAASKTGTGALVTPGRYSLVAPDCKGSEVAKATFRVTAGSGTRPSAYVSIAATTDGQGYWLAQANGTVRAFGDAKAYGGAAPASRSHVVGLARTYDNGGYWLASSDGHVSALGDAKSYGSVAPSQASAAPITGIAATPNGKGYWLLAADGHVFGFGDARVEGMPSQQWAPYVSIGTRPAGGYAVTAAANGALYLYPGGVLSGGGPGTAFAALVSGAAVTPSGNGTWEAGMDGGVITTGDASGAFYGSVPGDNGKLSAPVTAIASVPDGHGYWLLGANGKVFTFGDAAVLTPAK